MLVYRIGIDAGFFTELNNMIFMILYCLENHIRFEMYSDNANFAYNKGWNDYFQSFCPQVHHKLHAKVNIHAPKLKWKYVLHELSKNKSSRMLRWKIKNHVFKKIALFAKKTIFSKQLNYYTHDLYDKIDIKNRTYIIPDFVEGDYIAAYNKIFNIIWQFNEETQVRVNELISRLQLPKKYVACQIRGGDKFIEYDLLSVELYIEKLRKISPLRDVYVLTDDIRIYDQLLEKAPDFRLYTLCDKSQTGYYNTSFSKEKSAKKKEQMVRFLASMTILDASEVFLGTVTSAPSVTIGMRKYPNVHWIDYDPDEFYQVIDHSIPEIREISNAFLKTERNDLMSFE